MILPDYLLCRWASNGGVEPFDPDCINPASVDLRISTDLIIELNGRGDERFPLLYQHPFSLDVGNPVLVSTIEYIKMPHDCAGVVYLKSSLARQGLDHALAGFVDPGFEGNLTCELHAHYPITLHHNQRIVQLVLHRLEALPESTYHGKYQGQTGPTPARP